MSKSSEKFNIHDPIVGSGVLHWDDRGKVTEVGEFKRRGYSNLVHDSITNTNGSPKLIAFVRKSLDVAQPIYVTRYLISRLPFRIRLSDRRSFNLGPDGASIVGVLNPVSIKSDAEWEALVQKPSGQLPTGLDPYTWAMTYVESRRIKGDKLELLRTDVGDLTHVESIIKPDYDEEQSTKSYLNRFIVSYWNAGGTPTHDNRIRLLTDADMLREPHAWIACISNVRESPLAIAEEWKRFPSTRKPSAAVILYGQRNDLGPEVFTKMAAGLAKVSDYPAYYFALAGQGYMSAGDYQNGLLYYVMAFESAHQHFLEFALSEMGVPEAEARSNDLHMRAGIMTMLKITLHLFLTVSERPSKDSVEKTKKAIELRNSWVHGKRDKEGRLHALQIGRVEIRDLIMGVIECTNILLAILP